MQNFIINQGRIICLDTETTGVKTELGHKIIEIGCIELIDLQPTGNNFHCYLNPQRQIDPGSFAVHGLSSDFLKDKKLFADIVDSFLDYISDSPLIIHNANFDIGFLNYELSLVNKNKIQNKVVDSITFAKHKFPGSPASLDALCKRFNISLDDRTLHGALIDSTLLSKVYINLCNASQDSVFNDNNTLSEDLMNSIKNQKLSSALLDAIKIIKPSESEVLIHQSFFKK